MFDYSEHEEFLNWPEHRKLTRDNYHEWASRVSNFLRGRSLDKYIETDETAGDLDSREDEKKMQWHSPSYL